MEAVICAGGLGVRLRPYTYTVPKPLIPIGGYSILEILLRQLKHYGFTRITLALGYKSDVIRATASGINSNLGLDLYFHEEEEPLGTVGAVKQIFKHRKPPPSFLVVNCDVLTVLHFARLYNYHLQRKPILTVGAVQREELMELGVLTAGEDGELVDLQEKPLFHFLAVMGCNVFSKEALDYIPNGKFDLDDLIYILLKGKILIQTFVFKGLWFDLGRADLLEQAEQTFHLSPETFLPDSIT